MRIPCPYCGPRGHDEFAYHGDTIGSVSVGGVERFHAMFQPLLFDVLRQFDPDNRLVDQARQEVLSRQLDGTRLAAALRRIEALPLALTDVERLSPLAFPLWAERLQSQVLSSESWKDRVMRMAARLERSAGSHAH